jgi:hypothetical protein
VAVVDFDYKQTAAACGVSDSTAYKVLVSKERKPSFEVACRMADHLGITMDQLRKMILDGDGEREGEGSEELELGTQSQTTQVA